MNATKKSDNKQKPTDIALEIAWKMVQEKKETERKAREGLERWIEAHKDD